MTTLAQLVDEYGANSFIYCDAGSGCGFGENGQAIDYDDDAATAYGAVELSPLDSPIKSNDGIECNFASGWIVSGEGMYRFRLMF